MPQDDGIGTAKPWRIDHYGGVARQSMNRINDFRFPSMVI
jgi:hypothetical protein